MKFLFDGKKNRLLFPAIVSFVIKKKLNICSNEETNVQFILVHPPESCTILFFFRCRAYVKMKKNALLFSNELKAHFNNVFLPARYPL